MNFESKREKELFLISNGWIELSFTASRWQDPISIQILQTEEAVQEQRKRLEEKDKKGLFHR